MSAIVSTPIDAQAKTAPTSSRLFFLDLSAGSILSANPDGSDLKTIIKEGRNCPMAWCSANLDGSNRRSLLFAEGNLTGITYAEVPSGYCATTPRGPPGNLRSK